MNLNESAAYICPHDQNGAMQTVSIDRDACISCAACWLLCPELFIKERKDEKSAIQPRHRIEGRPGEGVVPGDQMRAAAEAVAACPVHLIILR